MKDDAPQMRALHSAELERGVLGALLCDPNSASSVPLRPEDFCEVVHMRIFHAIIADRAKSYVSIVASLDGDETLTELGGAASYLSGLVAVAEPAIALPAHAATLRDLAQRREMKAILADALADITTMRSKQTASDISATVHAMLSSVQKSTGESRLYDPWRDYAVPAFPFDVLPVALRDFSKAKSTETGACRSAIAMSTLAVCSGALTHEAVLYLKRGTFAVRPNLWVMNVGAVSARKTPIMKSAIDPLRKLQKQRFADYKQTKQQEPDTKPPAQLIVYDTTEEALADTLSHQSRGIIVFRDELSGWIGGMEKYGGRGGTSHNRALWLQARDGGPYQVQRITRKTLPIKNLSCSILGGIQTSLLPSLRDLTSDGLLQRFIPVMMRKARRDSDVFNAAVWRDYEDFVGNLLTYGKFSVELSPEAARVRRSFADYIFDLEQNESESEAFQGFVGKQQGVWGNLCLLLHVLWLEPGDHISAAVSEETAERASRLIRDFVVPHGLAFYRTLTGTSGASGFADHKSIGAWLAARPEAGLIKARDFAMGPRCCRSIGVEDIGKKLAPFVAGGWLEPVEPFPSNAAWILNPDVHRIFQKQASAYVEQVKALQERIAGKESDTDEG